MGRRSRLKCHKGSAADVLSVGICVLAMTVVMIAYTGGIQMMQGKAQVDQVLRKYLLRMETVGYLTEEDRVYMTQELLTLGVSEPDYSGSTVNPVGYGEPITLMVRGKIPGRTIAIGANLLDSVQKSVMYEFEEMKVSTAKN